MSTSELQLDRLAPHEGYSLPMKARHTTPPCNLLRALAPVVVGMLLTIFVAGEIFLRHRSISEHSSEVHSRVTQAARISARIAFLNEVLTMSARLHAAPGAERWKQRYLALAPELELAIEKAKAKDETIEEIPQCSRRDEVVDTPQPGATLLVAAEDERGHLSGHVPLAQRTGLQR